MFDARYSIRTHVACAVTADTVGATVTVAGWVAKRRDHGGLIFIDLRDRSGIVQCTFDPEASGAAFVTAERVRPEWVVKFTGVVRRRPEGTENPNMITGEVEIAITAAEVLNTSETPPFEIEPGIDTDEITRMRYRYLDIRRPEVFHALLLRDRVAQRFRRALESYGFMEMETPILGKSTPEGARDFIVPSRMSPGRFMRSRSRRSSSSSCSWWQASSATIRSRGASGTRTSAPTGSRSSPRWTSRCPSSPKMTCCP